MAQISTHEDPLRSRFPSQINVHFVRTYVRQSIIDVAKPKQIHPWMSFLHLVPVT